MIKGRRGHISAAAWAALPRPATGTPIPPRQDNVWLQLQFLPFLGETQEEVSLWTVPHISPEVTSQERPPEICGWDWQTWPTPPQLKMCPSTAQLWGHEPQKGPAQR